MSMSACRHDSRATSRATRSSIVDLAAWRTAHGWDKNSVVADAQIDFDPDTLQLTIASRQPLPTVSAVNQIEIDILGKDAGADQSAWPAGRSRREAGMESRPSLRGER